MLHLKTALETSDRADIGTRLTGRFYTPLVIAEKLARSGASIGCPESICDPFCGDGRLVLAWLRHLGSRSGLRRLQKISLWDYDRDAVAAATEAVKTELGTLGAHWVEIDTRVGDTFRAVQSEHFELVVTNPPWEQLKPDSRDGVRDASRYRSEIQSYASFLASLHPAAASCRRRSIGGYTVNLARAGALLAAELVKPNGLLQIVLPATIFGDQVSGVFRSTLLSSIGVSEIEVYPAEAKLFSGVDQSVVTIVARVGRGSSKFEIRRFRPDLSIDDVRTHVVSDLAEPLPLAVGGPQNEILQWLQRQHPKAAWLESDLRFGLRLGRELDETKIADAFSDNAQGVPFLKGRNIARFGTIPDDLPLIDPRLRKIPQSVELRRAVWRDVSRPSQKRRVHACLVPKGVVTGNSLGVARFDSASPNLLEMLVGLMNSLVFEAQIRGLLATNHVSQGVIRRCVVPYAIFEDEALRSFVSELVSKPTAANQRTLEIKLAKAHGLSREQFAVLLHTFDKLSDDEVDALLDKDVWS